MNSYNSKTQKHISFLGKVGFLIRYNDLELYHGRSQTSEDEWCVKTDIDNSHSENSNNIMSIPCLCVASYGIAESYARGASLDGRTGKEKIHEIVATDDNALVVNEKFNVNKLSEGEALRFFQAIQALSSTVFKNYLNGENDRKCAACEIDGMLDGFKLISENEAEKICQELASRGIAAERALIDEVVGAINANLFFQRFPVMMVSDYVFEKQKSRDYISSGGQKFRINQDYVRSILDSHNIIGIDKKAFSGANDHIVYVFDLSKVQTLEKLQDFQK